MDLAVRFWRAVGLLGLASLLAVAWGADAPKPPETPGTGEKTEPLEGAPEDAVAKVDSLVITRADLAAVRRQIALDARRLVPNNEQLVEQLIERVLLQRHFTQQGLQPTGDDIGRFIRNLDADLRRQGDSYQRWIAARGLTAEEHASIIAFELAKQNLVARVQKGITEEEIKTEFDAHPEWYDGSRVRVSQIFIQAPSAAVDSEKSDKAKERIEKLHKDLGGGKDFERLARDYSDGAASATGGDRGWFYRKGPEVDEPLIEAAWKLKIGEFTQAIRGAQGWHILKVTDREPARFTYFGSKPGVMQELTNRRFKALMEEQRAKAKIQKFL